MNIFVKPKHYPSMTIASIVLGIILVAFPDRSLSYIVIAIGALVVISSVLSIVSYYNLKSQGVHQSPSSTIVLNSVLSCMVGVLLIVSPLFFVGFLLLLLSVLLFLAALFQLITLLSANSKVRVPIYMFFTPVVLLIISSIMIFAPINSAKAITIMFGCGLILFSALELYSFYNLNGKK